MWLYGFYWVVSIVKGFIKCTCYMTTLLVTFSYNQSEKAQELFLSRNAYVSSKYHLLRIYNQYMHFIHIANQNMNEMLIILKAYY